MIKVRFYGFVRTQVGMSSIELNAGTVDEMLKYICNEFEDINMGILKNSLIFVNSANITDLRMFKTELMEGDEVMILSPAAGG